MTRLERVWRMTFAMGSASVAQDWSQEWIRELRRASSFQCAFYMQDRVLNLRVLLEKCPCVLEDYAELARPGITSGMSRITSGRLAYDPSVAFNGLWCEMGLYYVLYAAGKDSVGNFCSRASACMESVS